MDAADALPPPRVRAGAPASADLGGRALRAVPWRGRHDVVLLVARGQETPTPGEVEAAVRRMAERGVRQVVTGALNGAEQVPFRAAGFEVCDRLHLLRHDLVDLPSAPRSGSRLHRGRRPDHDAALVVDGRAFEPFWRLDEAGLVDAIRATTTARFRVAVDPSAGVVGYAVTGRAGDRGYVQRLAVDPEHRRLGTGATLVLDGLRWLRRRRTHSAVVNTQVGNEAALALYRRLGFELQPEGLSVLTATTGPL